MSGVMVVTGASRGIGAATARLAAEHGYSVAVNYVANELAADEVVEHCRRLGAGAIAVRADVSDEAEVRTLMATTEAELGRPTVLVNNAGILHQQMRFDEMSVERWREALDVNIIGSFLCAREAVRRMSTRHGGPGGSIVNVSSAASYLGSPGEYIDYAATKAAVDTLTIGLAQEVATEAIRVNAVRPGLIHTDIHASGGEPDRIARVASSVPMQRGGTPEEVARTILWLASDEASYVTGALVNCSGGR
ncbi:MAG: SDR family oxidoreductase [Acidimicrobiia bacterium]|nr:SDR family oxidoreductase [Acidimicrobiia bacterium]